MPRLHFISSSPSTRSVAFSSCASSSSFSSAFLSFSSFFSKVPLSSRLSSLTPQYLVLPSLARLSPLSAAAAASLSAASRTAAATAAAATAAATAATSRPPFLPPQSVAAATAASLRSAAFISSCPPPPHPPSSSSSPAAAAIPLRSAAAAAAAVSPASASAAAAPHRGAAAAAAASGFLRRVCLVHNSSSCIALLSQHLQACSQLSPPSLSKFPPAAADTAAAVVLLPPSPLTSYLMISLTDEAAAGAAAATTEKQQLQPHQQEPTPRACNSISSRGADPTAETPHRSSSAVTQSAAAAIKGEGKKNEETESEEQQGGGDARSSSRSRNSSSSSGNRGWDRSSAKDTSSSSSTDASSSCYSNSRNSSRDNSSSRDSSSRNNSSRNNSSSIRENSRSWRGGRGRENILERKIAAVVGVDCEGVRLGRYGQISLLQISFPTGATLLVDALKKEIFTECHLLKNLLESSSVLKVFHDCREDAAALFHQQGIRLSHVFDTQVAYQLFLERKKETIYQASLTELLQRFLYKKDGQLTKEAKEKMDEDPSLWFQRPLPSTLLRYAVFGVSHLISLAHALSFHVSCEEVLQRSEAYVVYRHLNEAYSSPTEMAQPGTILQGMVAAKTAGGITFKLNSTYCGVASAAAAVSRFNDVGVGDFVEVEVVRTSADGRVLLVDRAEPLLNSPAHRRRHHYQTGMALCHDEMQVDPLLLLEHDEDEMDGFV